MRFETPLFATALAVVAAAAVPATTSAAPTISAVTTPLVTPVDSTRVAGVAVGDGTIVWAENGPALGDPIALRTNDANGPRTVAQLPYTLPQSGPELEVGRTADGSVVVAVTVRKQEGTTIELVRLSDGRRVTLPSRLRGGTLRGVGIDRGWIYATRGTGKFPERGASLWRARINGLDVGAYTRIRSATRAETWTRIAADRNRVAVLAGHGVKRDGAFLEETWLAGTPRGAVVRVGQTYATDGGYEPRLVAGFTRGGREMIMVRNDTYAPSPAKVQRVPLRGAAKPRTVQVDAPMQSDAAAIAYDGTVDRLMAVGPDAATGTSVLGTVTAPWDPTGR